MKFNLLLILFISFLSAKAQVIANAGSDKFICLNDTLKVTGTGLNVGDTGTYQWIDLNTGSVVSANENLKVKITTLISRKYELYVTRTHNKVKYYSRDTFALTVNTLPTFTYSGSGARCFDQGCWNLTTGNVAMAQPGNKTGLHYFQKNKTPSWISSSSPYIYCPKISNSQVPQTGLRDTICYDFRDSNGCFNLECKTLRLYPNPIVNLNSVIICQAAGPYELGKLITEPISSNRVGGIESFKVLEVPAGSGVNANNIITIDAVSIPNKYYLDLGMKSEPQKAGNYIVEYCFKNAITGCLRCDTNIVSVVRLPKIKFDPIPAMCVNQSMVALDSFVKDSFTGKRLNFGKWECIEYNKSRNLTISSVKNAINNSIYQQHYFKPKTGSGTYLLKFTDFSSGCSISDSVEANVYGLPQIKLAAPDTICANSGMYALPSTNYAINDTNGKWYGRYLVNNLYNSDSALLGNQYSSVSQLNYRYSNPLTTCSDTVYTFRTMIKRPTFKFSETLRPQSKYLLDFDIIDSNMNLSNYQWLWYFGNGDTSSQKYPKGIFYKDSGTYKAYLMVYNGYCSTIDSLSFTLNKVISGIHSIERDLKIYPNPANNYIDILLPIDAKINLYDIRGQLKMNSSAEANQVNRLSIQDLETGVYMLSIRNNELSYWVKLVKTN